jgi:hypothetical protein
MSRALRGRPRTECLLSQRDRAKKLFQFLNEIGARALRIQLGRVLEMAESSPDKFTYENKIAERFGGQKELELIVPTPSTVTLSGARVE